MKTKRETKTKLEPSEKGGLVLTEQQIADFTKLAECQKDADANGKERTQRGTGLLRGDRSGQRRFYTN